MAKIGYNSTTTLASSPQPQMWRAIETPLHSVHHGKDHCSRCVIAEAKGRLVGVSLDRVCLFGIHGRNQQGGVGWGGVVELFCRLRISGRVPQR